MGLGVTGKIPEREDNLARPRSRKGSDQRPVTKGEARPTTWPEPDPEWHTLAIDVYNGCRESGQSDYYQQSDIAILRSLCDDLTYAKRSTKRSGQLLQTIYSGLERLLVTEGDRRRVRIELNQPEDLAESEGDKAVAEYRQGLLLIEGGGESEGA